MKLTQTDSFVLFFVFFFHLFSFFFFFQYIYLICLDCLTPEICEFRDAVGEHSDKLIAASQTTNAAQHREAMKDCFVGMMQMDKSVVSKALECLVSRVKDLSKLFKYLLLLVDKAVPRVSSKVRKSERVALIDCSAPI